VCLCVLLTKLSNWGRVEDKTEDVRGRQSLVLRIRAGPTAAEKRRGERAGEKQR